MRDLIDGLKKFDSKFSGLVDKVQTKVLELYKSRRLFVLSYTGVGFLVAPSIFEINEGGSSSFLASGNLPYGREFSKRELRYIAPKAYGQASVASGHATSAWLRAAGEYMKQDRTADVPRLIAFAITGSIQTEDQRPDRPTAVFATAELGTKILEKHNVAINCHKEMTRVEQDILTTLVGFNFILERCGIPQIPLPKELIGRTLSDNFVMTDAGIVIVPKRIKITLSDEHRKELLSEGGSILIMPNRTVESGTAFDPDKHCLLPTSLNGITPPHDEALTRIEEQTHRKKMGVFELSLKNANPEKGDVEIDEILERVAQVDGYAPALIVNGGGRFIDKARRLRAKGMTFKHFDIAVGADIIAKVINPDFCDGRDVRATLQELYESGVRIHFMDRCGEALTHDGLMDLYPEFRRLFPVLQTGWEAKKDSSSSVLRLAAKVWRMPTSIAA